MAKSGFAYYNVDTNRYSDLKIKRLKKEMGCTGLAVYDYLLCQIYGDKGYYVQWSSDLSFDIADYFDITEEQIFEIVNCCCDIGLFNRKIFSEKDIITAASIQKRYIDNSIRAKRKDIKIPEEMLLIPEEMAKIPEECIKFPEEIKSHSKSSGSFQQSKVSKVNKESKVSKVSNTDTNVSVVEKISTEEAEELKKQKEQYDNLPKTKISLNEFLKLRPRFIEPYVEFWNIFAEEKGFGRLRGISKMRRQHFNARLREKQFDFREVLRKASHSTQILSSTWFSFDWIIKSENNYLKVLEGNYDNKPGVSGNSPLASGQKENPSLKAMKELLEDEQH